MGMLIDGVWTDREELIQAGKFVRAPSGIGGPIGSEVIDALATQPGRFCLIGSLSCPWSHRAMLMRVLKGLGASLPQHCAHGPRVEGYAVNGGAPWRVPGTSLEIVHLHELYCLGDPGYSGRSTVPVLWDGQEQCVVSNDSAAIMRALDRVGGADGYVLAPEQLLPAIDRMNEEIYGLNNGVYQAGFAPTQQAYEAAVDGVFGILDGLESRLLQQRYLLGQVITEADWRLFPTLVRFDAIYAILHKCSRRRLVDYRHLWAYTRELYSWHGVAGSVDFGVMRDASYLNDTSSANGIVAVAPDVDWSAPHGRDAFGPARVMLRSGGTAVIEPTSLQLRNA